MSTYRLCLSCGDERRFDCPPCLDGHGAECPELACVDCGAALLIDPQSAPAARFRAGLSNPILGSAA